MEYLLLIPYTLIVVYFTISFYKEKPELESKLELEPKVVDDLIDLISERQQKLNDTTLNVYNKWPWNPKFHLELSNEALEHINASIGDPIYIDFCKDDNGNFLIIRKDSNGSNK